MGLFESNVPIDNITVMVQKEVADRMQVGPGTKDYGALSLAVQYYAEPYIVANVPPNCFIPRPNVGSAVIRLTRHQAPPVQADDPKLMFRIIRASFNQRRKTLQNGLNNSPEIPYSKEEIAAAIESLGVSPSVRGEALTLEQFARLANYFSGIVRNIRDLHYQGLLKNCCHQIQFMLYLSPLCESPLPFFYTEMKYQMEKFTAPKVPQQSLAAATGSRTSQYKKLGKIKKYRCFCYVYLRSLNIAEAAFLLRSIQ